MVTTRLRPESSRTSPLRSAACWWELTSQSGLYFIGLRAESRMRLWPGCDRYPKGVAILRRVGTSPMQWENHSRMNCVSWKGRMYRSHLFHNFLAGSLLRWPNEPCTCNNKLRVCGQWPIFDTICNCFMMLQCLTCFGSNSDENDHSMHPLFGTRILFKVATRWWRIFWKNSYAQSLFTATNGACGCFWKLCINARLQWGRSPCICIMPVCHCQVMPTRNFNLSVASSSNVWRWTPTPCISSPRPCAWTWRSRRQPRRMSLERSAQRCHLRGELG